MMKCNATLMPLGVRDVKTTKLTHGSKNKETEENTYTSRGY
jgi:hypothetical protein